MDAYSSPLLGHNGEFSLQKYLMLQSQQEELRQHLNEMRPYYYTTSSTAVTSPASSPTRSFSSLPSPTMGYKNSPSPSRNHRRSTASSRSGYRCCSAGQLEPVLDETLIEEVALEERKLFDVNEGIKRTLTELLNCETVRKDKALRNWVQCRLMETEKELRVGRRRRTASD